MNSKYGLWALCVIVLSLLVAEKGFSQFKRTTDDQPKISDSFIRPETDSDLLGFFNPENFKMRQSISMGYTTVGGQGLALGTYTNSMMYKFSSKVDARVDVSLQNSPYSSFDQRLQNSLSGVFLNRAEINYRPSDNMLLRVSYEKIPFGLNGMFSPYAGYYHGLGNDEGY
ncbi:MAG: hypothetical protein WBZ48_11650 [Bacteroidota bacterium]